MTEFKHDNEMRTQVFQAPDQLLAVFNDLDAQARTVLSTPQIFQFKRVVLTGCGDCHAAALASRQVFEQLIQNRAVECIGPLDLSKYYPEFKAAGEGPGETLVIAMSNGGKTPRVIEAAARMKRLGARLIAITANEASPLAQMADGRITLRLPERKPAPGTASYAAMLMCCHLLAIRLAEVRMRITGDRADVCRQDLKNLLCGMKRLLPAWDETAVQFANQNEEAGITEMIGSGCEAGSAYYGCAKFYEAVGIPGAGIQSEEWFHLHCFGKMGAHTLTMLFTDRENSAHGRVLELAQRLQMMRRPYAVCGDAQGMDTPFAFPMPPAELTFFRPLVQWAPAALVASCMAQARSEPYHRGFQGVWKEGANTPSSWNSAIDGEDAPC